MFEHALAAEVLARLSRDPHPDPEREILVLAALEGPEALARYIDDAAPPAKPKPTPAPEPDPTKEPPGAYLKSITVEGFRGIGPRKTLDLPPGPGLTLVVGRNGSGKSSFAEALELLLTGDTFRWRKPRPAIWREGWRNLHHRKAAIEAEFYVEGDKPTKVVSQWKDDALLEDAETFAQPHAPALKTYQPILSYNELGSMLDQGPSKLKGALSAILGLDELTDAQGTLAEARKARDKASKEAGETRETLLAHLQELARPRSGEYHVVICSPLDTPQGLGRGYFVSGGLDAD